MIVEAQELRSDRNERWKMENGKWETGDRKRPNMNDMWKSIHRPNAVPILRRKPRLQTTSVFMMDGDLISGCIVDDE